MPGRFDNDPWFIDATEELDRTTSPRTDRMRRQKEEREAREADRDRERDRLRRLAGGRVFTPPAGPSSPASRLAATVFDQVASGVMPVVGTGMPAPWEMPGVGGGFIPPRPGSDYQPATMTPKQELRAILRDIRSSEDPMVAAGEWLTKITTSITSLMRELDGDDDNLS